MGTKPETAYRSFAIRVSSFADEVSGLVDAVARLVITIGRSVSAMTRLVRPLARDETRQAKEETVFTSFGIRVWSFVDDVTRLVDAMTSLVRLLTGEETTCAKQDPAVASLPDDRASFVNRLTSFATAVTSLLTAIATLVNWVGKRVRFWPSGVHGPLRLGPARKNEGAGPREPRGSTRAARALSFLGSSATTGHSKTRRASPSSASGRSETTLGDECGGCSQNEGGSTRHEMRSTCDCDRRYALRRPS